MYAMLFAACLTAAVLQGQERYIDYVDPLTGSQDSRWIMFPGPALPFSMVKLSPDNQELGWKAGYDYSINNIAGFSHIHSWTMAGVLTMPTTGALQIKPGTEKHPERGYRSLFDHASEKASPGYYSVFLDDYRVKAELTSTMRTGFQRYTFPENDSARILIDLLFPSEYGFELFYTQIAKVSDREIEGMSYQQSLRKANYNEYIVHFVMRFSKPFRSFNGWVREDVYRDVDWVSSGFDHKDVGAFVEFTTGEGEQVMVQTGISLVSVEQARKNLDTELGPFNWDFDAVREAAEYTWEELLGKIKVTGGTLENKKKFYTNLYRSYVGRTTWNDVDGRYVDMYEKIRQLPEGTPSIYGSDGFWITIWNLNQLWPLITPDITSRWVKSFLEIYDRGGWLPKGPTGIEYSGIMVASHQIAFIVGAYQKGIRDFDVVKAYQACYKLQTLPGGPHKAGGVVGNRNLEEYVKYGYVPDEDGPVSNTMEYAYDDWSLGQFAKALGKENDYKYFTKRSFNYKNVFDPDVGYIRRKHEDGTWVDGFSPFGQVTFLGSGFVEGNAWQFTYFVPHDLAGLIELMGREEFNSRLEEGFEISSPYNFNSENLGSNSLEGMGILPVNHGNQPNMQAAYLFNHGGKPWLTQKWVREIMDRYYGTGPADGWLGDEDQGQMGAWFVMSAIGLFEMDGGASVDPVYELGSPLFEKTVIELDQRYYPGKEFVIEAENVSDQNRYIQSARLNGKPLDRPWFHHRELVSGGRLVLQMGPAPNKQWGSRPEDAPPSLSIVLSPEEKNEILEFDKTAAELDEWNMAMKAYYYHRKDHFERLPDTKHEIIFLGNSITDNAEWFELFENPNVKNRGIGGDDTDGVLGRLDEVVRSRPDKIFLMIGTNDLAAGKSVEYIISNYRLILRRIREASPETQVYIQSILPTEDAIHTTRNNRDIMRINKELRAIAGDEGLVYIDLFTPFATPENKLNMDYSLDGLHLNGAGYELWKKLILELVTPREQAVRPVEKPERRHMREVVRDTFFTGLFRRSGEGFTGGDGTYSIPLPDGRTAWLFGDTFIGGIDPGRHTRSRTEPVYIRNSMVVQDGTELETFYRKLNNRNASFVIHPDAFRGDGTLAEDSVWFWPGDGYCGDGLLRIFLSGFVRTGTGMWDFRWTGTSVASFSLPDLAQKEIIPIPYGLQAGIHFGHALLEDKQYIYVYGSGDGKPHAARFPRGRINGSWEFFDGETWTGNAAAARPMADIDVSEQFSVFRQGDLYVLITQEGGISDEICSFTAGTPYGPWGNRQLLYRTPIPGSARNLITYNALAHPQFTEDGMLLVSYNVNSMVLEDLFKDAWIYRPRFIRVPLEMIHPSPVAHTEVRTARTGDDQMCGIITTTD
jgi:predicted alpha-1,2-mannosidase